MLHSPLHTQSRYRARLDPVPIRQTSNKTKERWLSPVQDSSRKCLRDALKVEMARNPNDELIKSNYEQAHREYKELDRGGSGVACAKWVEQFEDRCEE
jgi:hypothetical protein